ncbi:hypothetical protein [Neorhizobium galegae]|uniref:Uncharacterized protein n=1 Tax=Neorhizobium galegae bv. orientalis str. HAMBI 540 TaxID=1028800 RepID=A0A068SP30_NEOGA|nr:hypothetical protein [Neorhizobium galegae]CDN46825.1 Hypothetical protein RG540_CH06350 [Neorhizobium galegae bv. orientalis str. HAMBI 540]
MTSAVNAFKQLIAHQTRKELVSRPRVRTSTIRIESHDQEQELVIGGGSDVSYAVVQTSVDYSPPE